MSPAISVTLDSGEPDTDPPTPNPAGFASAPNAISESAITMTAVSGTDASGRRGVLLCRDIWENTVVRSGWQSSASYTDSGLSDATQYSYTVKMRDSLGNVGTPSSALSATTDTAPVPTTFTGASNGDWNLAGNWDGGLPAGSVDVSIASGKTASNSSVTPASSTGKLILNSGSAVQVINNDGAVGEANVISVPSYIEFKGGMIDIQSKDSVDIASLVMSGDGKFTSTQTSGDSRTRNLNNGVSGAGKLIIEGRNKQLWNVGSNNTFTGGLDITALDRYEVKLNASGSAGAGKVKVTPRNQDGRSAVLLVNASGALSNVTELTLNGKGWDNSGGGNHAGTSHKLVLNVNDSVGSLIVDDVAQAVGTYGKLGHGGVDNEVSWISGNGILTVDNEVSLAAGYDSWKESYGSLSNADASIDYDDGGLATGVEWVLGGDPTDSNDDALIKPTWNMSSGNYVFTFRRTDIANDDPNTTITVEYSNDLSTWMTATHGGAITVTENNDAAGAGVDTVSVSFSPNTFSNQKAYSQA